MNLGLRGRAAFVAASSKGMGRAIAEQFAAEGADVGMCARSDATLQKAADAARTRRSRRGHYRGRRRPRADEDRCRAQRDRIREARRAGRQRRRSTASLLRRPRRPGVGDCASLTFMSAVHLVQAALPALSQSDFSGHPLHHLDQRRTADQRVDPEQQHSRRRQRSCQDAFQRACATHPRQLAASGLDQDRSADRAGACLRGDRPRRVLRTCRRDQPPRPSR